ncbi:MAG: DUF1116 domain-containing protein [Coriobacteriales bacterium]|jgi:hypothetical protein|nr:DUF1116 domain-containing protein [Coriobacteriales bacterium]
MIAELWGQPIKAVNLGNKDFYEDLVSQGVEAIHLDWKPVANGEHALIAALDLLDSDPKVARANQTALERINAAQTFLIDIQPALEAIPGMTADTILHAGPPITWERMSGPVRGAVCGGLIFEGRATTYEEAEALVLSGKVHFSPCNEHSAVGPMAGVITPSMPVFVVENRSQGNRSFSTLNEGLGKVLRFGAYGDEVLTRLAWMRDVLAPALKKALAQSEGIDIKSIAAQALHMGDEVHNRNKAATSLLIRELIPLLLEADIPTQERIEVVRFINSNDHFFLNLSMASAKATLAAAEGIEGCSIVTVLCRNGTDFGIQVSGLPGRWFTGPAGDVKGLLFPGFTEADKNPDLGDSAITETLGLGGFSMAASIAIVQFVGGEPKDALVYSRKMYRITEGSSSTYSIPMLDFRGSPTGIDIRKVIETGILPQINTGIAHREAGIGQVGAGLVTPPWECFSEALLALAQAQS